MSDTREIVLAKREGFEMAFARTCADKEQGKKLACAIYPLPKRLREITFVSGGGRFRCLDGVIQFYSPSSDVWLQSDTYAAGRLASLQDLIRNPEEEIVP